MSEETPQFYRLHERSERSIGSLDGGSSYDISNITTIVGDFGIRAAKGRHFMREHYDGSIIINYNRRSEDGLKPLAKIRAKLGYFAGRVLNHDTHTATYQPIDSRQVPESVVDEYFTLPDTVKVHGFEDRHA